MNFCKGELVKYIYHYTTLEIALKYILPNRELRLGEYSKTNDPKENKEFWFGINNFNENDKCDALSIMKNVSKTLQENTKMISFTKDIGDEYGGYENWMLWAHYGGKHTGVCLKIDKETFIDENKSLIVQEDINCITYQYPKTRYEIYNNLPIYDYEKLKSKDYLLNEFRVENKESLFFRKYMYWKGENEIRLIKFSNNNEAEYCSINKSLDQIYLGLDFDKKCMKALSQVYNKEPVPLLYVEGRCSIDNNKLKN